MDTRIRRAILELRLAGLRGHILTVGETPGFARELQKAEAQLQEIPAVEGAGAGAVRGPHGL
jgi:hypothetical protein